MKSSIGIVLFLLVLLSSCASKKQLTYVQDINRGKEKEFYPVTSQMYKLQNNDVLYVRVISVNEEVNRLYNLVPIESSQQMYSNDQGIFLNGFVINNDGNIELPLIGKIKVAGLTIPEAQAEIIKAAEVFLKMPTIIVKQLNFKVTVLGEVRSPGVYKNYNNQLTVLEALGFAGDMTDHADRRNVLVMRPSANGTETYRFDLTRKDILSSEAFFLQPNDIVYVEPKNSKAFQLNMPTMTLILSTISTMVLILNFTTK